MGSSNQTEPVSRSAARIIPYLRTLLVAAVFGLAALAIVAAGFNFVIPGTGVVTDPREIFTTTGAGLTGPLGGLVIGVLAGVLEPHGIPLASILAHVAGGLWMGLSYKLLVYRHLEMPARILGWAGLVLVYYYLLVVPGFVLGIFIFYPHLYEADTNLLREYLVLARGALPEALLTMLVTSLVLAALPRRHQRPLW